MSCVIYHEVRLSDNILIEGSPYSREIIRVAMNTTHPSASSN